MSEHERDYAIMEGGRNAATDAYFAARLQLDCLDRRRVYEAGFKEAWEKQQGRIAALEAEVTTLRGEQTEYLCEECNVIHPVQRNGVLQPCPTCGAAMLPTSRNVRRIKELEAAVDEGLRCSLLAKDRQYEIIDLRKQLAAYQLRVKELRDVVWLSHEHLKLQQGYTPGHNVFEANDKALSTPDDTSALDKLEAGYQARIGELREAIVQFRNEKTLERAHAVRSTDGYGAMEKAAFPVTTDNPEALRRYVAGEMRKAGIYCAYSGMNLQDYADRYEKGKVK